MDPLDFNANSGLRASDADRDRAASVLNEALAEGRLTPEEHSERLDSIYAAKTQADLVPVLKDLPAVAGSGSPAASRISVVFPAPLGPTSAAIMPSPTRNDTSSSRTRPSGRAWLTCATSM